MYEIRVTESFSAAHRLREYKGKCERIHGHNWEVEIAVSAGSLHKNGMVLDFVWTRKTLRKILNELDHTMINKHPYFRTKNVTAENIAYFIYKKMEDSLPKGRSLNISEVIVSETPKSQAIYRNII